MTLKMSQEEREAFLADLHVGIIAIDEPGRAPLTVPIWYDYSPELGVWVLTGPESKKARLLRQAGRFSLCAQSEEPPYKYVSVEGPIVSTGPADTEQHSRPMARRYLGPERGDAYIASQSAADSIRLVMKPERWLTVDYSKM